MTQDNTNHDDHQLFGYAREDAPAVRFDPDIAPSAVDFLDLGAAVTETVVIAVYGGLGDKATQAKIDKITSEYGTALLVELVRFPPYPTTFSDTATIRDLAAWHVAGIINTLIDGVGETRRARIELAQLCFAACGWSIHDAAETFRRHVTGSDVPTPDNPNVNALLITAGVFSDPNIDASLERYARRLW